MCYCVILTPQMCSMYFITVVYVVISAWRCFALIIRNPGDNHALWALAHLVETPAGSQDPLFGGS